MRDVVNTIVAFLKSELIGVTSQLLWHVLEVIHVCSSSLPGSVTVDEGHLMEYVKISVSLSLRKLII